MIDRAANAGVSTPTRRGRLIRSIETLAHSRHATWILAAIAFADSSFLPLAPDLLLIPMMLARPRQVWLLSLICTIASALGAALGYFIGYKLWAFIGAPLVEFYHYTAGFEAYRHLVEEWGVWIIIAKALTPIPFKIMAIAAGVAAMNPVKFMIAAVVGRALHFAMVAGLVIAFGERLMAFVGKYERLAWGIGIAVVLALVVAWHFR